jgi:hypothetical protein
MALTKDDVQAAVVAGEQAALQLGDERVEEIVEVLNHIARSGPGAARDSA